MSATKPVTGEEFDKCFNASFIQLTFANFVVAMFIMSRVGFGKAINVLYIRSSIDILIQIPMAYMCINPTNTYGVEAMWKTFDFLKTIIFPMTAMYTIILIPPQSKVGKYKKQMVFGTYFVWGVFWLTGLSLESRCAFEKVCDLVGPKVPRQLMGFAYFTVVFSDTLFSILSIMEYVERSANASVIIQQFCRNKLFRVFCINLSGLVFYSILTYGRMDANSSDEETIGGRWILRLLDSYGNFMLTLYLVEFILSKLELTQARESTIHNSSGKKATTAPVSSSKQPVSVTMAHGNTTTGSFLATTISPA
ncbi:hypothetical protein BKA69DRAFT_102975 [Paraphysoderma sedebokerense]|nr:hypothetical protein BKA69DRAFT_102975 [Paraphysoderma sedebokerense]